MSEVNYAKNEYGSKLYFSDCKENGSIVERPLWFHKRGLMQTATGYGSKLTTEYMLKHNNRLYRIYCCCFSNVGSLYILKGKTRHYIAD